MFGTTRYICLADIYIEHENIEACLSLPEKILDGGPPPRGYCLDILARNIKNETICELITNIQRKEFCEEYFE